MLLVLFFSREKVKDYFRRDLLKLKENKFSDEVLKNALALSDPDSFLVPLDIPDAGSTFDERSTDTTTDVTAH